MTAPATVVRSAGVVIARRGGGDWRLLVLRSGKHWDFPKGLLEEGESAHDAARRDATDGTGISDPAFGSPETQGGMALVQATNASLTLTNLQASDAAEYCVVVTNNYGSVTSTMALLTVNLVTVDSSFNPGAEGDFPYVYSLAVQADGKILVGGLFASVNGTTRNRIARLHADGRLDLDFNPGADSEVLGVALQADGAILVGGKALWVGRRTLASPDSSTIRPRRPSASLMPRK